MDKVSANWVIALAILPVVGAFVGSMLSPLITGRAARQNANATRRFDLFVDACADAMAYTDNARVHIVSFCGPDTWPEQGKHYPAPWQAITSRLNLLGPDVLTEGWKAFIDAYWRVFSESMTTEMGNERVVIQLDDPLVVAAFAAIDRTTLALRSAVGTRKA